MGGGCEMIEKVKISELCINFNLEYKGKDVEIDGLNLIGRFSSKSSVLSYVTSSKYKKKVAGEHRIMALVVSLDTVETYEDIMRDRNGCLILSEEPERDFYLFHDYLVSKGDFYKPSIECKSISDTAIIHQTAVVEDNVVIEDNVTIGAFSIVKSGSYIERDTTIGNYTIIGAEGYQVLKISGIPTKIKHCGGVHIENNVSIGDHCSVCNTLFDGNTRIGSYSKIDNYCQIAHYADIGKRVIMTPGVTIVGSVTIEDDCYIGAGATIMNKVVIQQGATVGIGAVVLQKVKAGVTVLGNPAKPIF